MVCLHGVWSINNLSAGSEKGGYSVEVETGREVATAVYLYSNGVIDEKLPESGVPLEPDWALQDPQDCLRVFQTAIPEVLEDSGITPTT